MTSHRDIGAPALSRKRLRCAALVIALGLGVVPARAEFADWPAPVAEILRQRAHEADTAYRKSPFSMLSRDYLARIARDPAAKPAADEVEIRSVRIVLATQPRRIAANMAKLLSGFLQRRMKVRVDLGGRPDRSGAARYEIRLSDSGGGRPDAADSFTIGVSRRGATIAGHDIDGLRDGIVRLIDRMGLRRAPILKLGSETLAPRQRIRVGAVPWLGSMRDLVLMGYNAVLLRPYADLHEISSSRIIPELVGLQDGAALERYARLARQAHRFGLEAYLHINNRMRFPEDAALFRAHPEIEGPRVGDGTDGHILSTESPLVKEYIADTTARLFRDIPDLDGLLVIVGGEGFYHCYMHPFGFAKGETDRRLCGPAGAEETVADLVNTMAVAARSVKPGADVIAWPYSAQFVWSRDPYQAGFIAELLPAASLAGEVVNGEIVADPDGVVKQYWDYSIGRIGLGRRASRQVALAHAGGHAIYLESEPELSLDFGALPFVPSPPRWWRRADAVAASGADGILALPYFEPFYASLGAEMHKFAWWAPTASLPAIESSFARRVAGAGAGDLVKAWDLVSQATALSPQIPRYFSGPLFLGPAHPLMLDTNVALPRVFLGPMLSEAEVGVAKALTPVSAVERTPQFRPVVDVTEDGAFRLVSTPRNTVARFAERYRAMRRLLDESIPLFEAALSKSPPAGRIALESELSVARWFAHTIRTTANFYQAGELRQCVLAAAPPAGTTREECYRRIVAIVADEEGNTRAALKVLEHDMRLDVYYQPFTAFAHSRDMIAAKLLLLRHDREVYLPELRRRLSAAPSDAPQRH